MTQWVSDTMERKTKLDPYKGLIDQWFSLDMTLPRRNRQTGRDIYLRLCDEYPDEFNCGYKTVVSYVSKKKKKYFIGG